MLFHVFTHFKNLCYQRCHSAACCADKLILASRPYLVLCVRGHHLCGRRLCTSDLSHCHALHIFSIKPKIFHAC